MLFFTLGFAVLFVLAAGLRFLAIRLDWVRALSRPQPSVLSGLVSAARWALSFALYGGVLLGLSYAVRRKVFMPASVLCVLALSLCLLWCLSAGLDSWKDLPSQGGPDKVLGGPGLILASSGRPSATSIVLLKGLAEPDGARVVAVPGKPVYYQGEYAGRNQALASLPPVPFGDDSPWFLKSIAIDIRLNAETLQRLFNEGAAPFLVYAGALVFLLSSLVFILKFSVWPLANLFLGCLALRGILALEVFFNSDEMRDAFGSFLQGRLPLSLAVPLIFAGAGLLVHLYSFLIYLTKRQSSHAA